MNSTAQTVSKIVFDMADCGRCGGTGSMPFAAYGGVCFGCNGKGRKLTARGRAAHRKLEAWAEQNLIVAASAVEVGDRVHVMGKSVKVTARTTKLGAGRVSSRTVIDGEAVDTTVQLGETTIESATCGYTVAAHAPVRRGWTRETLTLAAPVVARMSGATIVYADVETAVA